MPISFQPAFWGLGRNAAGCHFHRRFEPSTQCAIERSPFTGGGETLGMNPGASSRQRLLRIEVKRTCYSDDSKKPVPVIAFPASHTCANRVTIVQCRPIRPFGAHLIYSVSPFEISVSAWMSIRQPVRRAARRAFCPSLPIASESW